MSWHKPDPLPMLFAGGIILALGLIALLIRNLLELPPAY